MFSFFLYFLEFSYFNNAAYVLKLYIFIKLSQIVYLIISKIEAFYTVSFALRFYYEVGEKYIMGVIVLHRSRGWKDLRFSVCKYVRVCVCV